MKAPMILCGNYGAGNVGDEAILRALLEELRPSYNLTVMSARPRETKRHFKVKCVGFLPSGIRSFLKAHGTRRGRWELKKTREAIHKVEFFVLGGGTLLTDEPRRSLWIWRCQVAEALRQGKKVWIYRGGIGPLRSWWAARWVRRLLKRAERVNVRDQKSMEWSLRLGIHHGELAEDPVLKWKGHLRAKKRNKNTIIFVPRYWIKNENKMVQELSQFIRYLCLKENKKVIGIPFEKEHRKDIQNLNKIFEQSGVGERAVVWTDYRDDCEVIRQFQTAELVVGMRLHSLIFAHLTRTPFMAVSYSEKVSAFLEEIHAEDRGIDLENLNLEALKQLYKSVLKRSR